MFQQSFNFNVKITFIPIEILISIPFSTLILGTRSLPLCFLSSPGEWHDYSFENATNQFCKHLNTITHDLSVSFDAIVIAVESLNKPRINQ
jgi:hypothetical protein